MRHAGVWTSGCVLLAIILSAGCQSDPNHTETGALCGGLLGAGAGALLAGPHHAAAGALIGGAAGAATGAVVGNSADREEAARNRYVATAVTTSKVIAMVQAKVSDDEIIKDVKLHGVLAKPTSDDLIVLKQNRVSDRVIDAMRSAPVVVPRAVVYERSPVIVEYEYGPPPPCYYYHRPPPW